MHNDCDCFFDPHAGEWTERCVAHALYARLGILPQRHSDAERESTPREWNWLHGGARP